MRMRSVGTGLTYALVCVAISTMLLRGSAATNEISTAAVESKIEDLAWISGDWETASGPVQIEEHWTRVAGGSMIGMGRTIAQGRFSSSTCESKREPMVFITSRIRRPGRAPTSSWCASRASLLHSRTLRMIFRSG